MVVHCRLRLQVEHKGKMETGKDFMGLKESRVEVVTTRARGKKIEEARNDNYSEQAHLQGQFA